MKFITLIAMIYLIAVGHVEASEKCKTAGEQAKKIMQYRQNKDDLFIALEKYDDKEMVISAFERPRYNAMRALESLINANTPTQRQIAESRYDEVSTQQDNEVNLFKMKYIKLCFLSK